jgi:hypothetical protein
VRRGGGLLKGKWVQSPNDKPHPNDLQRLQMPSRITNKKGENEMKKALMVNTTK